MAVAALSEGLITPDFRVTCTGAREFYGHLFRCDKKDGHGTLDLRRAIEKSCDVYFYVIANLMNVDTIHRYARLLGLTGKTGIDLPGEVESLVPSTEWKRRTTGDRWYPGETISVGIGQGQVSVTPMSLAVMISTIANGGAIVTPHVVKGVDVGEGWRDLTVTPPRTLFHFPQEVLEPVHDGLWMVVNAAGTATGARVPGYDVSGKTGTAQVVSTRTKQEMAGRSSRNLESHAWFEFYAPRGAPEIAGVVLAEHGGYGAQSAVPIAKFVLETYFAKKDGRPLPAWPKPQPVTAPPPAPAQETAEIQ
jgi:penicillin-binding protein 2